MLHTQQQGHEHQNVSKIKVKIVWGQISSPPLKFTKDHKLHTTMKLLQMAMNVRISHLSKGIMPILKHTICTMKF